MEKEENERQLYDVTTGKQYQQPLLANVNSKQMNSINVNIYI